MPEDGNGPVPGAAPVARCHELHDARGDGRDGDVLAQGVGDEPVDLARVLDVGADAAQAWQALGHQVEEPAADDGPVPPRLEDAGHVDGGRRGVEQRQAFAEPLQHGELDAVVHQLDVVAHARPSCAHDAAGHGQVGEDGVDLPEVGGPSAEHEAGTRARASQAAARAGVHEADAAARKPRLAPDGVAPVRVPGVHHHVALVQVGRQTPQDLLHGRSGWHGHEDAPGRRQLPAQVGQ